MNSYKVVSVLYMTYNFSQLMESTDITVQPTFLYYN
jgi:hypothetical protein